MLGLGLAGLSESAYLVGLTAGVYHLISHALFKAALFLCAGSVIHAVETIYMNNMGGLGKSMPITKILMLLATLSLAGIPPFVGFWSKDSIFVAGLVVGSYPAMILYGVAVITAIITLIYSVRYICMVFYGDKSTFINDLEHHGHHLHEAPKTMWVPILILVIVMLGISLLGFVGLFIPGYNPELFIEHQMESTLENLHVELPHFNIDSSLKLSAYASSGAIILLGGITGWMFYWTRKINSWKFVTGNSILKPIHTFLWNRWYINDLYYAVFVNGLLKLSTIIFINFEEKILMPISDNVSKISQVYSKTFYNIFEEKIELGYVNTLVPKLVMYMSNQIKQIQTGFLRLNLIYLVILMLVLLLGFLFFGGL
jgi:NADH-quinone oxidoreductase subunit L